MRGWPAILVLLFATVIAAAGPVASAADRGLAIVLRESADPNAPVSEKVELYSSSYALVIGNDAYSEGWQRLSNAVNDARAVAETLAKEGFEVTLKENLDSVSLRDQIREFFAIRGADPKARLFFWYAGHGHSIKGEGFLVPVDAPLPSIPEFKLKALHMRDFGSLMRLAESKHAFAVFDSCFSGTIFSSRSGAVPAAITRATTLPTRQFLTSGDADQEVSDDGTFRQLFVRALTGEAPADANGDGYLTASEIGLYLSSEVTNYTEEAQTPRYGKLRDPDYDRGDFVFALPARLAAPAATVPPPAAAGQAAGEGADVGAQDPAQMMEITFWASVAASDDPTVIATYLEKYPEGNFAGLAKARITALEKQAAATPTDAAAPADTAATGDAPVAAADQPGQDAAADEPALTLESGVNLAAVDGKDDLSWLPSVGATATESFQLTEQRLLPEGFFGVGEAAATLSKTTASVASDVGDRGYAVAGSAWNFSDPQADSQYRIDKEWVHLRAPGNHDLWDCRRHLAPILSVPAPDTDSWTAQVWFQLPARIGKSHTGLVVWNGVDKDGPTHALYFGPANTDGMSAGGSYRSDCSGGSGDIAGRPDSRGTFNLHYTGGRGWLRITKAGDRLSFYFKSPFMNEWRLVGSMLTEIKDGLVNVGLMAKTWGSEPVIASYADFRIIPGVATVEAWQPAYYARLEADGAVAFEGSEFADFEWDDPNGDSIHEIAGAAVTLKTGGNHDIWDCRRKSAPILSVKAPPLDRWSAEVDFDMPARVGRSHLGLIAWNGRSEEAPVHALYFGPAETNGLSVGGSNAVDCSSGSGDLSRQFQSEGPFSIGYDRGKGRLRIARDGDRISFYFKSPAKRNWQHVGTTLASVRDDFSRIGLMMKTWGGEPVTVTFSNFRILAGETEPGRSIPNYYADLKTGQPVTFAGEDFADFEWSDPEGNSVNEIRGKRVRLYTGGGHGGIWDCRRNKAPILSVEVPPREAWVAQARFKVPARADRTSANLVLWNGAESDEAKWLAFGPGNVKGLNVSGSYSDDCSASSGEIAKHSGNTGSFGIDNHVGGEGTLQIVKFGWSYRFSLFDPQTGEWTTLGAVQSTVKDNFSRIGMTVTSWGGNPIEAEFSDFTIIPGLFN